MHRTKTAHTKKVSAHADADNQKDVGDSAILVPNKLVKISDTDLHEDVASIVEEKIEVDPLIADEESDETSADEALDDDEINPFGDKWEV